MDFVEIISELDLTKFEKRKIIKKWEEYLK